MGDGGWGALSGITNDRPLDDILVVAKVAISCLPFMLMRAPPTILLVRKSAIILLVRFCHSFFLSAEWNGTSLGCMV
jgi:hypothetical protein